MAEIIHCQSLKMISPYMIEIVIDIINQFTKRTQWRSFDPLEEAKMKATITSFRAILNFDITQSSNPYGYLHSILYKTIYEDLQRRKLVETDKTYTLCEI